MKAIKNSRNFFSKWFQVRRRLWFWLFSYRTDIFKILFWIIIKVHDPAGWSIDAVTRAGQIKSRHGLFNFFFYTSVFLFIIERTMLENNLLIFGNIDHIHLRRRFAFIIKRETYTPTFCTGNPLVAEPSIWIINISHNLTAAAVGFTFAFIVQFAFKAVK